MPRTKANPNELYVREIRITPADGKPIEDWKISETDFKMVVGAVEGGTPDVRLHYHLYVESLRSASWITKWIYSIAHCYNGEQGNTVFFSRKPHDNTLGYVVKHGNIVVRHGCTETFITEWLAKSEQYRRDKDANRKRNQRIEKAFTHQVRDTLVEHLKTHTDARTEEACLELIIQSYHEANKIYPSRATVELLIVSALAPYRPNMVRSFYLKNFSP